MSQPEQTCVIPFAQADGQPTFSEAWQAQVLAIVDTLIAEGPLTARDWSATFGEFLAAAQNKGKPDDMDTYYAAALQALESLLETHSVLTPEEVQQRRRQWEQAYLNTPHGSPVSLNTH